MAVDAQQIRNIKRAVTTRHDGHKAELAALRQQLVTIDTEIARIKRPPETSPDYDMLSLGEWSGWTQRREKELVAKRSRLCQLIDAAREKAAGSFSQCEAVEWIEKRAQDEEKKEAEKRQERQLMNAALASKKL